MLIDRVDETYIFFPLMKLKDIYKLEYGAIGPTSKLYSTYPRIEKLVPITSTCRVDGVNIADPIFAVSDKYFEKFLEEIECITYMCFDEEISPKRIMFNIKVEEKNQWVCVDRYTSIPIDTIYSCMIRLEELPKDFSIWDIEQVENFEEKLRECLEDGLYKALIRCINADVKDKELQKEKKRIITSIFIFNEFLLYKYPSHPFVNTPIIFLAAAFEALLNLPSESIASSFEHIITMLVGKKTTNLKKWCKEFYDYRSNLVHGDLEWGKEDKIFKCSGYGKETHRNIACGLFSYCLKTRLFLKGLYPDYKREDFDIDSFLGIV